VIFFCYYRLRRTGDRPIQPAYEIKLMLHVARLMSINSDFLFAITKRTNIANVYIGDYLCSIFSYDVSPLLIRVKKGTVLQLSYFSSLDTLL